MHYTKCTTQNAIILYFCVLVSSCFIKIYLVTGFPSLLPPPCSGENPADLQHRDEVEDEGAHDGGRRDLLEVDLGEHDLAGDRDHRLPLVHGGRLAGETAV